MRQPTMAGASWTSASSVSASTMNSAKSTRRVRLPASTGSPTCRLHTGRPCRAPRSTGEVSLPFSDSAGLDEVAGAILREMPADAYPHLTELATEHVLKPGYAYADEFTFGISLILDALHPDEDETEGAEGVS
ncbi:hypothetical protein ABT390_08835 [Streptomyces aurantiacus]|uniref:hypothetical protein n=1 Tax=Streptomyces aurantiacus TaxID=47760 RepID=UPI00216AD532|nr:hypothetical protein [Streptomyces aurantiacus]